MPAIREDARRTEVRNGLLAQFFAGVSAAAIGRPAAFAAACPAAFALVLAATPAAAQWNPFKPNFGRPVEQPAPQPEPEPEPAPKPAKPAPKPPVKPAAKPAHNPTPKPAPNSAPKPAASAPSAPAPVAPAQPAPVDQAGSGTEAAPPAAPAARVPLPPRRPSELGTAAGSAPVAAGAAAAAAVEAAKAAGSTGSNSIPETPVAGLARVNAWLNSYDSIQADFVQHSANGQKAEGTLYVKRPGQLRFKYDPPSTLEVVADGKSVAVRDTRLGTNDVYSIGQTPLKFLLRDRVDLASDAKLQNVAIDPTGIVRVSLEDSSTLGGTSKLTLIFDAKANELKQWNVTDPQGYRTTVALYNLRLTRRAEVPAANQPKSAFDRLFDGSR